MSPIKLPKGMKVFERGWLSSNNILIWGDDDVSIIDTGYVSQEKMTLSLIQHELKINKLPSLTKIVNTHLHSDHCGGNQLLSTTYNCPIFIPEAESHAIKTWDDDLLSFKATGQTCPPFKHNATLTPGQSIRLGSSDWQIIAAPGHAPHSIIFYEEELQILISADALWEDGFGVIFPELTGDGGFEEVSQTLDLIDELNIKLVIPGHGKLFTDIKKSINIARSRLDYLASDTSRNARHAAKVLLKFKLLEWQSKDLHTVNAWITETPLLKAIANQLNFTMDELCQWLISALCHAGAAQVTNDLLINID